MAEWLRKNWHWFAGLVVVGALASTVIAEKASTDSVKEHDTSQNVHSALRQEIQQNSVNIRVLSETVKQTDMRQSRAIDRLEAVLVRFEERMDERD